MQTTQQADAARLLLQRRNARRSLADWARICGYEPAKHHLFLIEKLEAVVRGEIRRLAIFMPPGSAKSTYSSILFPPWFLAQKPDSSILTASHSADLATAFGRRSRNLILDKENVLGYSLRKDSQAADEWTTTDNGVFFCAGVGGRIAGRRADLGLIDDPVGSKEDAYSKVVRDSTWDWYRFDFRTRLKPNAALVLIQTRWHEDDLAGRILASEGNEWQVINLPMLAKESDPLGRQVGAMLWDGYFNDTLLRDAQKDRAMFSALYQQDPSPEDGDYFRRSWIEDNAYDRDELPDMSELSEYVGSDHAVSQKQDADSTCMVPAGLDSRNVLWVLPDIFWDKCDTGVMVDAMLAMMKRHSLRTWWAESEQISKSIGPFLRQRMREQGVFCYIEEARPARDKQTRAQSIRGRFQTGTIRLPRFAPWYNKAVEQMLKFPAGSHDDFIDALAHIGLGLDKMVRGTDTAPVIDPSFYMKDRPLSVQWLKGTEERQRMRKLVALRDN
jgi:predicted phage terminase large subunit-like protein